MGRVNGNPGKLVYKEGGKIVLRLQAPRRVDVHTGGVAD